MPTTSTMAHPRQSSSAMRSSARMSILSVLLSLLIVAQNGWTVHAGVDAPAVRRANANANGAGAGRSNIIIGAVASYSQRQSLLSSSSLRRHNKRILQDDTTTTAATDPADDATSTAATTTTVDMEEFVAESYETISEAVEEKLDSNEPITPEDEENLVEAMEELNELAEVAAEKAGDMEVLAALKNETDPEEIVFGEDPEEIEFGEGEGEGEMTTYPEEPEMPEEPEVPEGLGGDEPIDEKVTTSSEETTTTSTLASMEEEGEPAGGEDVVDEMTDPNAVVNDPYAEPTSEAPPAWDVSENDPYGEATTEAPPVEGEVTITTTATPPAAAMTTSTSPEDGDDQEDLGPPLIYESGTVPPTPDANKWGEEGSGPWGIGAKTTTAPTPDYGEYETSVPTPADDNDEEPWDWGANYPLYPTKSPTDRPTALYIPKEGDPLMTEEEPDVEAFEEDNVFYHGLGGTVGEYLDGVESPVEMEQDKNVQVVAGILVGLFMVLMLVTAHLVMQYPDGLCAGCCRLTLKCICCFTRTLCLPCRAICCKGSDQSQGRRTHAPMRTPFPSDLELA